MTDLADLILTLNTTRPTEQQLIAPAIEWRVVPGFERYKVSNTGFVKSFTRDERGIDLTFFYDRRGYPTVRLYSGPGKKRSISVHRVVSAAFLGEPTGPVVRHLDDDKLNNNVSNLAYGTYSQNTIDSVVNGGHYSASKTHCIRGHEFTEENTRRDKSNGRQCRACCNERARRQRIENPKPPITHCQRGHELAGDNIFTRTRADGSVTRVCRICFAVARTRYSQNIQARKLAK
jgi:hypothetical protein